MTPAVVLGVDRPDTQTVVLSLELPARHPAFDGHFPGKPVLPGVVQIDWVARLAADYFGIDSFAATDFQVKFRRVIEPGPDLRLTLRLDRTSGSLSFEYRTVGAPASSGRISLAPPP
jgi:3-hydroxymyristoyl/3-hydroxydecanoyl-(acyl carrier protein) dehydratase